MDIRIAVAAFIAAILTLNTACAASVPEVKDGGLNGEVITATGLLFSNGSHTFFTVPANKYFILTQACYLSGASDFRLENIGEGGDQGSQAPLDNSVCKEFTPGLRYNSGVDVVFRNNGSSSVRFLINGVLMP